MEGAAVQAIYGSNGHFLSHIPLQSEEARLPDGICRASGRRLKRILLAHSMTSARWSATAVGLVDKGLICVGHETYTQQNGSYGATTLRQEHLYIDGSEITLYYRGKSGQQREIEIGNCALVWGLKTCQELPGQRLFRYSGRVTTRGTGGKQGAR